MKDTLLITKNSARLSSFFFFSCFSEEKVRLVENDKVIRQDKAITRTLSLVVSDLRAETKGSQFESSC